MKQKMADLWARVRRGCSRGIAAVKKAAVVTADAVKKAAKAVARVTRPAWSRVAPVVVTASLVVWRCMRRVWDLGYRYHYWLGVQVLRRARRVMRFVARITYTPRRRLRYAWIAVISRPIHRFVHRMWRLLYGLPRSYVHLWVTMKKNVINVLLWLPRGVWHWFKDYKEEWFSLGRFLGPIAGAVFLVTTIQMWTQTRFCLVLTYRGTELGVIENAAVYDQGAAMARSRVTTIDDKFTVDEVPKLTMVVRGAKSTMSANDVCEAILLHSFDSKTIVEATALYMDGEFLGAVEDGEALEAMLEEIKQSSVPQEDSSDEKEEKASKAKDDKKEEENQPVIVDERIEFVQNIKTETGLFLHSALKDVEEIRQHLQTKEITEVKYEVQKGDTLIGIANKYNMKMEELQRLNNIADADVGKLQIGQVLMVQRPKYRLQVVMVKTIREENVPVKFNTRTVYRNDQYTDWSRITTEGVPGTKTVLIDITTLDGYELERTVAEETITLEPVTQVREVGTKKRPSNDWTWPVPVCHVIYQGYHSGHKAMDVSSGPVPVMGKPTVAVADGVVIEADSEWNGGYGTVVKIRHDNGLITVYAHLSALKVTKGQRVSRGQTVGLIGNSGNSFGPHLHFEVIKNGVKVNPLNYVRP